MEIAHGENQGLSGERSGASQGIYRKEAPGRATAGVVG